jgi:DNA mismatch repair protein MutS2
VAGRASSSGEPTLDLHGLYVRDALRRADAFLRAEQARGTVSVHIITGHGTGALKDALSDFLAGHPSVARVTTPLQGDAGRRIVLRPPARNTPRA